MSYDYDFRSRAAGQPEDLISERLVEDVGVNQGSGGFSFKIYERTYPRSSMDKTSEEKVEWDLEIESSVSGYRTVIKVPMMHDIPAALAGAFARLASRCQEVEATHGEKNTYVDGWERYGPVDTESELGPSTFCLNVGFK